MRPALFTMLVVAALTACGGSDENPPPPAPVPAAATPAAESTSSREPVATAPSPLDRKALAEDLDKRWMEEWIAQD